MYIMYTVYHIRYISYTHCSVHYHPKKYCEICILYTILYTNIANMITYGTNISYPLVN